QISDTVGCDKQVLRVCSRWMVGVAAMISHDPQHRLTNRRISWKRSFLRSRLSRYSKVRGMHERGQRAALSPSFWRIIRNTLHHEQRTEIRIAKTQRAEVIRLLRHRDTRKLSHVDG